MLFVSSDQISNFKKSHHCQGNPKRFLFSGKTQIAKNLFCVGPFFLCDVTDTVNFCIFGMVSTILTDQESQKQKMIETAQNGHKITGQNDLQLVSLFWN